MSATSTKDARRGVAPSLLFQQVANTAKWALESGSESSHLRILNGAHELDARWQKHDGRGDYFSLMLAAHFTTVATFVPTDVDNHIRHLIWKEVANADELEQFVARIDEAAMWDPRLVSNRTVDDREGGVLSGHDGEWFSVRAGALGRAFALGATNVTDKLEGQIREQLDRHARVYARLAESEPLDALRAATVLAHNLGDLSRVVDTWQLSSEKTKALQHDFSRLGHEPREKYGTTFVEAGLVNKAIMADENHRYLPLRKPRALRSKKEFVIPFGPFFDAWGETIARDTEIAPRDLAEIVDALIQGFTALPKCAAFVRALAGIHRRTRGGIDRIIKDDLPVRTQRVAYAGPIREALRIEPAAFAARIEKAFYAARDAIRASAL